MTLEQPDQRLLDLLPVVRQGPPRPAGLRLRARHQRHDLPAGQRRRRLLQHQPRRRERPGSSSTTSFNTNQFYAGQIGADFAGAGMGGVQWWFGGMQDNGNSTWDSRTAEPHRHRPLRGRRRLLHHLRPASRAPRPRAGGSASTPTAPCTARSTRRGRSVLQLPLRPEPDRQRRLERALPAGHAALHQQRQCRNMIFGEDYVHAAGAYGTQKPDLDPGLRAALPRTTSGGSIIALNLAPSNPKSAVGGHQRRQALVVGEHLHRHRLHAGRGQHLVLRLHAEQRGHLARRRLDQRRAAEPRHPGRGRRSRPITPAIYAAVGGFDDNTPDHAGPRLPVQVERHGLDPRQQDRQPARRAGLGHRGEPAQPQAGLRGHLLRLLLHGRHRRGHAGLGPLPVGPAEHGHQVPDDRPRPGVDSATWGTTLVAFTYGRGVYAIKLPTGGTLPGALSEEKTLQIEAPGSRGLLFFHLEEMLVEQDRGAAGAQAFDSKPVPPRAEPADRYRCAGIAQDGIRGPLAGPEHFAAAIHQLEAVLAIDRTIGQAQRHGEAVRAGRGGARGAPRLRRVGNRLREASARAGRTGG